MTARSSWLAGHHGPACERGPRSARIGVVFQHYSLFPHVGAEQRDAGGPQRCTAGQDRAREHGLELLDRIGEGQGERIPGRLSGGQRQRVAIARALA